MSSGLEPEHTLTSAGAEGCGGFSPSGGRRAGEGAYGAGHALAMSVDVEPWWASDLLSADRFSPQDDELPEKVAAILDLLEEHGARATFFVLGREAERFPRMVEEIARRGHEVASHSYDHTDLHRLYPKEFLRTESRTREVLADLSGVMPAGFRAPSFSLDRETTWLYPALQELGYRYSSSLFPLRTPFYGARGFPLSPFEVGGYPKTRSSRGDRSLVEFPLTVFRLGPLKIPVCGGAYLRFQPSSLVTRLLRDILRERPAVFFIHPRDLFPPADPPSDLRLPVRLALFGSLGDTREKFRRILEGFSIKPIKEVLFPPIGDEAD